MPKQEIERDYKFSDADLKQGCDSLILCINRDNADFAKRGVTAATVAAFEQLTSNFADMPTDDELIGYVTTATETKAALRKKEEALIRSIRGMAEDKYMSKGFFRRFGFESLDRLDDNNLCRLAVRVHRVGTELQSEMQANGLSAAVLADLQLINSQFDKSIDDQDYAIRTRDNSTQERIIAGNTLYAERVRLSGIGKSLFQDTDEARYNDYVISDPGKPRPEAPSLA